MLKNISERTNNVFDATFFSISVQFIFFTLQSNLKWTLESRFQAQVKGASVYNNYSIMLFHFILICFAFQLKYVNIFISQFISHASGKYQPGYFIVFNLIFILYWNIVDLQYCVSFRYKAKWCYTLLYFLLEDNMLWLTSFS